MTMQITMELPTSSGSGLPRTPEDFVKEMRVAAAVKWYELELLSQGKAAEVAGLSRPDFHQALIRYKVSPIQTTVEELREECQRG
jgi:predicted HTH domain antitoxin